MDVKEISRLGETPKSSTIRAFNRTGAATVKGGIYALDLTGSSTEAVPFAEYIALNPPDVSKSPFGNVVAVGAGSDDGWVLVVAESVIADDAEGIFTLKGVTQVLMVGSSAIAIGARIAPTSGQAYASAEGDGIAICGIALEAGPTGSDPDLGWALFNGSCYSGPQSEV